jgi:hypothetical protein
MKFFSAKQYNFITFCFLAAFLIAGATLSAAETTADAEKTSAAESVKKSPPHQVLACYFHRTVRCPTCQKISVYIEEAIKTGFAAQVKDGSVKMIMIDFQNEKNKEAVEAYKITGPTLVIMDMHNGEVTAWKPAPKVWSLVGKKPEFFKYVKDEIQKYLDEKKPTAEAQSPTGKKPIKM